MGRKGNKLPGVTSARVRPGRYESCVTFGAKIAHVGSAYMWSDASGSYVSYSGCKLRRIYVFIRASVTVRLLARSLAITRSGISFQTHISLDLTGDMQDSPQRRAPCRINSQSRFSRLSRVVCATFYSYVRPRPPRRNRATILDGRRRRRDRKHDPSSPVGRTFVARELAGLQGVVSSAVIHPVQFSS